MLLRWVLEKANELALDVFVVARLYGRPLYERLGPCVVGDAMIVDAGEYGGEGESRYWVRTTPGRRSL